MASTSVLASTNAMASTSVMAAQSTSVKSALELMRNTLKGRLDGHYQHEGVRWMVEHELSTKIKGGILADDMGLGKTMQCIATMRANPKSTIIITMVGTVGQWRDALIEFGGFKPVIVNPSFKGLLPPSVDVVVTTYSCFQKASGSAPPCLFKQDWGRIVLDEGHLIRNPKTRVYKEISSIAADIKWVLSGTPIQNSEKDLLTLAQWIGYSSNTVEEICDRAVLRRTQEDEGKKNSRMALPPIHTKICRIPFRYEDEQKLYKKVESHYQDKMETSKSNNNMTTVLEGIMRCRQVCTHTALYDEGMQRKKKTGSKRKRTGTSPSSKLDYLCNDIESYLKASKGSPPAKCLIFCMWTLETKLIREELEQRNIPSLIFDGNLSRDAKETVLYNFKNTDIPVLILQILCGSTGLNLQCANRIYITSPNWNPTIELQAIGRCYRKGQTQSVTCLRLVMENTIEERCLEVQQNKAMVIADAMRDSNIHSRLGTPTDGLQLTSDDINRLFKPSSLSTAVEHEGDAIAAEPTGDAVVAEPEGALLEIRDKAHEGSTTTDESMSQDSIMPVSQSDGDLAITGVDPVRSGASLDWLSLDQLNLDQLIQTFTTDVGGHNDLLLCPSGDLHMSIPLPASPYTFMD